MLRKIRCRDDVVLVLIWCCGVWLLVCTPIVGKTMDSLVVLNWEIEMDEIAGGQCDTQRITTNLWCVC